MSIIMRTYTSVFDDVAIWFTLGPDLLLVGFTEEGADPFPRLVARASSPPYRAGLSRAGVEDLAALLVHELVPRGVVGGRTDDAQVHTLLHPILSDRAARAFFAGGHARLPSFAHLRDALAGERNSLLRRYVREKEGGLTSKDRAQLAGQLCQSRPNGCAVVLAEWLRHEPRSPALARRIRNAQQRFGSQRPPLSTAFLRRLSRFFAADASGLRRATPELAGQETQLFARYYFSGVPFHRGYLAGLFSRCATDEKNAQRCRKERQKAELQLGALGVKPGS
jgi:hypothetical protein